MRFPLNLVWRLAEVGVFFRNLKQIGIFDCFQVFWYHDCNFKMHQSRYVFCEIQRGRLNQPTQSADPGTSFGLLLGRNNPKLALTGQKNAFFGQKSFILKQP